MPIERKLVKDRPEGSRPNIWVFGVLGIVVILVGVASMQSYDSTQVLVPSGTFIYGASGESKSTDAFHIDKFEVTVGDYAKCVKAGSCTTEGLKVDSLCNWKNNKEKHPMNCVDWHQAKAYCRWQGRDLPTEIEWEKATRGIDGRKYPWGNKEYEDLNGKLVANIDSDSVEGYDDGQEHTSEVGMFPDGASPYGALDMAGNVWEWTDTWYEKDKYRVIRGGSWLFIPWRSQASIRGWWSLPRIGTSTLASVVSVESPEICDLFF